MKIWHHCIFAIRYCMTRLTCVCIRVDFVRTLFTARWIWLSSVFYFIHTTWGVLFSAKNNQYYSTDDIMNVIYVMLIWILLNLLSLFRNFRNRFQEKDEMFNVSEIFIDLSLMNILSLNMTSVIVRWWNWYLRFEDGSEKRNIYFLAKCHFITVIGSYCAITLNEIVKGIAISYWQSIKTTISKTTIFAVTYYLFFYKCLNMYIYCVIKFVIRKIRNSTYSMYVLIMYIIMIYIFPQKAMLCYLKNFLLIYIYYRETHCTVKVTRTRNRNYYSPFLVLRNIA